MPTSSSKLHYNCTTPQSKSTSPLTPSSPSSPPAAAARVHAGEYSPYVRAKHFQLVDRDPNKAIPLFWSAINNGDRVDSALKDMAVAMKQAGRAEEAVEAIKSFRGLCSIDAQEPIDNLLLDLYKKCGRTHDQIELLSLKLKLIGRGIAFGGRATKLSRSQGKRFHVSIDKERSRLLGNLAWAYMQTENYKEAESLYWEALAIEPDYNKQCNIAICLMRTGRFSEAKSLLLSVPKPSSSKNYTNAEPYLKSFERASEILEELGQQQSTPAARTKKLPSELQYSPSSYFTPHDPDQFRKERQQSTSEYFSNETGKCADEYTKELEECFMTPPSESPTGLIGTPEDNAAGTGTADHSATEREKVVVKETYKLQDQGLIPLQEKMIMSSNIGEEQFKTPSLVLSSKGRRTWADMVEEEEEEELMAFGDENVNSSNNIVGSSNITPHQKHRKTQRRGV